MSRSLLGLVTLGLLFLTGCEQKIPELTGPINDLANAIPDEQEGRMRTFLLEQEKKTTNQIVVLTVKSIGNDTIESYAEKVFSKWQLGEKKRDNGVLILAAIDDRKVRIEVGYGLEGPLPDILCDKIIRQEMKPHFEQSHFGDGILAAITAVDKATRGEYQAKPEGLETLSKTTIIIWVIVIVVVIIVVVVIVVAVEDRHGNIIGSFFDSISTSSGGSSSSWYTGGGGGSGGGGASGSW